jgi:hypothetical protein
MTNVAGAILASAMTIRSRQTCGGKVKMPRLMGCTRRAAGWALVACVSLAIDAALAAGPAAEAIACPSGQMSAAGTCVTVEEAAARIEIIYLPASKLALAVSVTMGAKASLSGNLSTDLLKEIAAYLAPKAPL